MGPPDCLSLDCNHSSAFQCENYCEDCGVYVQVGAMALQRQRLGAGAIAVLDPIERAITLNQLTPPFPHTGLFGISPPAGSPVAQRYNDLTPPLTLGIRGTVGVLVGDSSIEATSFYIFQQDKSITTASPGALDLFFVNAPRAFLGANNAGLFLQADRVTTTFGSSLWNNEVNFRHWNLGIGGLETILGVRYIGHGENLSIFTDTYGITRPANNLLVDPTQQATYQVLLQNNIVAPQFGGEYNLSVCRWLSCGGYGKAAFGADFVDFKTSLFRGDGLRAFQYHFDRTVFSQVFELGGFVDVHFCERFRFRAGYMALWLTNVATAVDQVNFDLGGDRSRFIAPASHNTNGSILYHGPLAELQFFF
jgi:hypothetical protein